MCCEPGAAALICDLQPAGDTSRRILKVLRVLFTPHPLFREMKRENARSAVFPAAALCSFLDRFPARAEVDKRSQTVEHDERLGDRRRD